MDLKYSLDRLKVDKQQLVSDLPRIAEPGDSVMNHIPRELTQGEYVT